MTYSFDVVVIGAGVVGLACAKQFSEHGYSTLVVEAEASFGVGISSRNSEVIHAGIYYPQNTLKSKLCRRGNELLYTYCAARNIPHRKIGKWIVAQTPEQSQRLQQIYQSGMDNGCQDLHFVTAAGIKSGEPNLRAAEVLSSPSTGIVDSHALMQSMVGDIENNGGIVIYRTPCISAQVNKSGFDLVLGGEEKAQINCRCLINASGLQAVDFAKKIVGLPKEKIPSACYAKGNYFSYAGKVPFGRLIYPVPESGGLGIHLTLDLNGQAKFGPDVEWIDEVNYQVNDGARSKFAAAIKSYWPACNELNLTASYAGIRPRIGTQNDFATDFLVQSHREHGINGLFNMFGVESPGLTSCLAIAEEVFSTYQEKRE